ncbi:hypothetical protein L0666_04205 [Octadecabacter sp. CECT 8868]|uniref:hypothetical protein n=1 Tax=Octadecabacter algicola TaxID=2909342 RepID=UPI001F447C35|nr:hypothetical protein [Octadecabacter algicola]MCF2904180.1 hypothetical protein [Octadecabacter algicola]
MSSSARLLASVIIAMVGASILAILALSFGFQPLSAGLTYCLSGSVILVLAAMSLPTCSEHDAENER